MGKGSTGGPDSKVIWYATMLVEGKTLNKCRQTESQAEGKTYKKEAQVLKQNGVKMNTRNGKPVKGSTKITSQRRLTNEKR